MNTALIPPAQKRNVVKYRDGETGDIMQEVWDCANENKTQLRQFAETLRGSTVYSTCQNIWQFVHSNITYREDPDGVQWVKDPARLWADKIGDCKSFSCFISSMLSSLGIPHKLRFVSFNRSKIPTHVYVVVPQPGGKLIKVDAVLNRFNYEKKPYTLKKDFSMAVISRLSGVGKISGGLFNDLVFGGTRKQLLFSALPNMAPAFLYLYLPDNMKNYVPDVVFKKRGMAFNTSWDWGAWAGIDVKTELYPKLREYITKYLGATPEAWWSKAMGMTVTKPEIFGVRGIGLVEQAAQLATDIGKSTLNSLVSSLAGQVPFTYPLISFAPDVTDWSGKGVNPLAMLPTQTATTAQTPSLPVLTDGFVPSGTPQNPGDAVPGTTTANSIDNKTIIMVAAAVVAAVLLTRQ